MGRAATLAPVCRGAPAGPKPGCGSKGERGAACEGGSIMTTRTGSPSALRDASEDVLAPAGSADRLPIGGAAAGCLADDWTAGGPPAAAGLGAVSANTFSLVLPPSSAVTSRRNCTALATGV